MSSSRRIPRFIVLFSLGHRWLFFVASLWAYVVVASFLCVCVVGSSFCRLRYILGQVLDVWGHTLYRLYLHKLYLPFFDGTLLVCYPVTLLPCYSVILLPCYSVTLLLCPLVTLSLCYPVTLFPCSLVPLLLCCHFFNFSLFLHDKSQFFSRIDAFSFFFGSQVVVEWFALQIGLRSE